MADQHNSNIPAMGNQISADIPDIKENLEFHKDAFQVIFQAWSDSDNSSGKFDSTTVFSDGTYTYTIPTNGVAGNAKFMIGDSNSIAWFYLNTAPPGWKALSTGADMVLAIAGGSGDYNVNGGNPDTANTWEIDGISVDAHSQHQHTMSATGLESHGTAGSNVYPLTSTTTAAGGPTTHTVSSDSSYRPKASVGKLFQLDTA